MSGLVGKDKPATKSNALPSRAPVGSGDERALMACPSVRSRALNCCSAAWRISAAMFGSFDQLSPSSRATADAVRSSSASRSAERSPVARRAYRSSHRARSESPRVATSLSHDTSTSSGSMSSVRTYDAALRRRRRCARHAARNGGAMACGADESDRQNRKPDALPDRPLIDEQVAEMNALEHVVDFALQQHPHRPNAAALRFGTALFADRMAHAVKVERGKLRCRDHFANRDVLWRLGAHVTAARSARAVHEA